MGTSRVTESFMSNKSVKKVYWAYLSVETRNILRITKEKTNNTWQEIGCKWESPARAFFYILVK